MLNDNDQTLRLFVAEGCGECQGIKDGLEQGSITYVGVPETIDVVDVVDVTTDEGYPFMDSFDIQAVPSAYLDRQLCRILVMPGDKEYVIDCTPSENINDEA